MQLKQHAESAKVEAPGRIAKELEQMSLHLADVEEMVNMLGERIGPILGPEEPEPEPALLDLPMTARQTSDITANLAHFSMRLSQLTVVLTGLRQRVEL